MRLGILSTIIFLLAAFGGGCKKFHSEKWELKTFPIKLEKQLQGLKTNGPGIKLTRKAVSTGPVQWDVDLRLLSRQKGKLLTPITTSLKESYTLISRETANQQGGLTATLEIRNPKVTSTPPMPEIEKAATKQLAEFKCVLQIDKNGKISSSDPKGNTTMKTVQHVTNLLNLLEILPDDPVTPGKTWSDVYTKQTHLVGGGILNTKYHMSYTFKGTLDRQGMKIAVVEARFKASGSSTNKNKNGTAVDTKGNGRALIFLDPKNGSLVQAEMHLSTLNKGKVQARDTGYDFAQYFETHLTIKRKK